jgi:hypothetical protein
MILCLDDRPRRPSLHGEEPPPTRADQDVRDPTRTKSGERPHSLFHSFAPIRVHWRISTLNPVHPRASDLGLLGRTVADAARPFFSAPLRLCVSAAKSTGATRAKGIELKSSPNGYATGCSRDA